MTIEDIRQIIAMVELAKSSDDWTLDGWRRNNYVELILSEYKN